MLKEEADYSMFKNLVLNDVTLTLYRCDTMLSSILVRVCPHTELLAIALAGIIKNG